MSTFANVYVGTAPNDLTGDTLRHAFEIINQNFANIAAGDANITINSPVQSVAGRAGNVLLSVNDVNGAASLASVIAQTNAANTYANVLYATTTSSITANVYSQVEANLASTIAGIASDLVTSGDLLAPLYANAAHQADQITGANARISTLTTSVNGSNATVALLVAANIATDANLGTATHNISALQAGATASNAAILTNTNRVAVANIRINSLANDVTTANNNIATLLANAATQQNTLTVLLANTVTQESEIRSMISNAAFQHDKLNTLDANLGVATLNIDSLSQDSVDQGNALDVLLSNSVIQSNQIDSLTANAATQASSLNILTSNAAVQASQIHTLDANLGTATTNIGLGVTATNALRANIEAANAAIITANVGVVSYVNSINSTLTTNAAAQGAAINTIFANLGVATTNINTLFANAVSQQTEIVALQAGNAAVIQSRIAYAIYANANIGTLYLGNISTNQKIDALGIYSNANAVSQQTSINNINANLGAYQTYANVRTAPTANLNSIIGNLIPITSNAYSIGSQTKQWKELYVGGNIQTTSYVLAARSIQSPLTETGNLSANTSIIYNEIIVGNIRTIPGYGALSTANLGKIITTGGVFWANGESYSDTVITNGYSNDNVATYLSNFDSNIVPVANVTYSLGSPTHWWKDLYVGSNTIYVGGHSVSVTSDGTLEVNGSAVNPSHGIALNTGANIQLSDTLVYGYAYPVSSGEGNPQNSIPGGRNVTINAGDPINNPFGNIIATDVNTAGLRGGTLTLNAGSSYDLAGDIYINAGAATIDPDIGSIQGTGGAVSISAGTGYQGGQFILNAGDSVTYPGSGSVSNGGQMELYAGNAQELGNGGYIYLVAGSGLGGSELTPEDYRQIGIEGGAQGGRVLVESGTGPYIGGPVDIVAGSGGFFGGDVTITAGGGYGNTAIGGSVTITGGAGSTTSTTGLPGTPGDVFVKGGPATATTGIPADSSGNVYITGGELEDYQISGGTHSTGGNVIIRGGNGAHRPNGTVFLTGNVNVAYTMGNAANWNTAPTTVAAALDELAARLRASGH
jgi:hypothetical protein